MDKAAIAQIIAMVIWQLAEFYLGKTDKVKAGSTLELIFNAVKSLFIKEIPK